MAILVVGGCGSDIKHLIRMSISNEVVVFLDEKVDVDSISGHQFSDILSEVKCLIRDETAAESRGKGAKRERKLARGW